jgi:hypothetical protein
VSKWGFVNVPRINATGAQVGIEMYGTETSINTAKEMIIELVGYFLYHCSIQIPQAKE